MFIIVDIVWSGRYEIFIFLLLRCVTVLVLFAYCFFNTLLCD